MQKKQAGNKSSKQPLTTRQAEFLKAFKAVIAANGGISPSLDELAKAFGVNRSSARTQVLVLKSKGYIRGAEGKRRALQLT